MVNRQWCCYGFVLIAVHLLHQHCYYQCLHHSTLEHNLNLRGMKGGPRGVEKKGGGGSWAKVPSTKLTSAGFLPRGLVGEVPTREVWSLCPSSNRVGFD